MKHEALIKKMTLEEKCSLLSGEGNFTTKGVKRLNVPPMFLSDGPHGVRKQAGAADHLGLNASLPATCFPTAASVANSWDPALGEEIGRYLGEECLAQRVNVLLGPGLNMKRSPLCGRNFEYFSEDPYLAGKMAASYIRGIQSKGISACPKHFAANNQEHLRMASDSVVDERTLREIYLTGFEIAVKESKPKCIMSSYNRINGVYASENAKLLQEILVDEWGFDGFVVTDWGGSNDHALSVAAGNHLEMPSTGGTSDLELIDAVRSGKLDEALLDRRVDEYLTVLMDTVIPEDTATAFDVEDHHAMARKAALSSAVLLRNEDNILPLKAGTAVAVIGDFAQTPRYQGAGSSMVNTTKLDSAMDAMQESGLQVVGYAAGFLRHGGEDQAKLDEAVALAKKAQVAVLYLGLDEIAESEGMDRAQMRLNDNQVKLLHAVAQVNSNVVVVFSGGAPVEMPWLEDCKALLHGYLSGQAGAGAVVDLLTGKVNPSGKLAETYPIRYEDTPAYRNFPGAERTTEYREGPFIGYRYYDTAGVPVRFPFGFGLSYTTFAYDQLEVSPTQVRFRITNTGERAGAEIAQVYVSSHGQVFHPVKELKGFTKIYLEAGQSQTVTIPLDDKAFRYFNVKTDRFEVEGGTYDILVGASAADIRLTGSVEVAGTGAPNPYEGLKLPSYESGKVSDVPDAEFAALLGRPIPQTKWDRTRLLDRNDTFAQLCYAKSWVGRLVYRILSGKKKKAEEAGKPDLNILFIYNMPFRGAAKMMGGAFDMAMADALLEIFNGHFFKGVGHLLGARSRMNKRMKAYREALANAGK